VILGAIDARIGEVWEMFDEAVRGLRVVQSDAKSQSRDFRNQNHPRSPLVTGHVTIWLSLPTKELAVSARGMAGRALTFGPPLV
jgi:hypothetical protein